jgi:hypothetical protein
MRPPTATPKKRSGRGDPVALDGQQSDRERTAAAGFDAHLIKPIDITEMDHTLRQLTRESTSAAEQSPLECDPRCEPDRSD